MSSLPTDGRFSSTPSSTSVSSSFSTLHNDRPGSMSAPSSMLLPLSLSNPVSSCGSPTITTLVTLSTTSVTSLATITRPRVNRSVSVCDLPRDAFKVETRDYLPSSHLHHSLSRPVESVHEKLNSQIAELDDRILECSDFEARRALRAKKRELKTLFRASPLNLPFDRSDSSGLACIPSTSSILDPSSIVSSSTPCEKSKTIQPAIPYRHNSNGTLSALPEVQSHSRISRSSSLNSNASQLIGQALALHVLRRRTTDPLAGKEAKENATGCRSNQGISMGSRDRCLQASTSFDFGKIRQRRSTVNGDWATDTASPSKNLPDSSILEKFVAGDNPIEQENPFITQLGSLELTQSEGDIDQSDTTDFKTKKQLESSSDNLLQDRLSAKVGADISGKLSLVDDQALQNALAEVDYVLAASSAPCPPTFDSCTDDVQVVVGCQLQIEVAVSGSPTPEVIWTKDDILIETNDLYKNFTINYDGRSAQLVVKKIRNADQGNYLVMARNEFGVAYSSCQVTVLQQSSQPLLRRPFHDVVVDRGHITVLSAEFESDSSTCVSWLRDGDCIDSTPDMIQKFEKGVASLQIMNAMPAHEGVYEVRLTNSAGTAACIASVKVSDTLSSSKVHPVEGYSGDILSLQGSARETKMSESLDLEIKLKESDYADDLEKRRKTSDRLKFLQLGKSVQASGASGAVSPTQPKGKWMSRQEEKEKATLHGKKFENGQNAGRHRLSTQSSSLGENKPSLHNSKGRPISRTGGFGGTEFRTFRLEAGVSSPRSPTSPGPRSPNAIKEMLLLWAKECTKGYPHVSIHNFSSSWNDGMAFCALIHKYFPKAFDFDKLDPNSRRFNFTLAFDAAEKLAGIAPLLEVDDMVKMKNPDWKCVFTTVQGYYRRFASSGSSAPTSPNEDLPHPLSPTALAVREETVE